MSSGFEKRLFVVWLVLSAITVSQLWVGSADASRRSIGTETGRMAEA